MRAVHPRWLGLLPCALLALAAPAMAAAPAPAPSTVEAPFCAAPRSGRCIGPEWRPAHFWWGHAVHADHEERYAGFVTLLPGPGDLPAKAGTRLLAVAEFVRRGAAWSVADLSGSVGTLLYPGWQVERRVFAPTKPQPDGSEVFAVPTVASGDGKRVHSYQILRRGPGGWAYGGSITAATDDLLSCPGGVPVDEGNADECGTEQGSLIFDGPAVEGWPGITVDVDLLTRRNGRPLTISGDDLRFYAYDPAAHGYVLHKP